MTPPDSARILFVIPNDPLYRYAAKGEVKERYFNPENFWDEIHVLSLCDRDEALDSARRMAGRAAVEIHAIGRPGALTWPGVLSRARKLAEEIKPQVIRAYNPLFMGWLAVRLAESSGAASVVSVHDDYSLSRSLKIYGPGYLFTTRGAYQIVHSLLGLNRTSLGRPDQVVCAYRFPVLYVRRWRKDDLSVIYNRVDLDQFKPAEPDQARQTGPLRILNVGRQFEGKDPEPIIRALSGLDNAALTLVGDGPYHDRLVRLAGQLGLSERVTFLPSVAHRELPGLYREQDVFAMSITQPGVCIPVLEASASGLPVVINQPRWEDKPEVVEDLAEVVPLSAEGYRLTFERLLKDDSYRRERGLALRERVLRIEGRAMEKAERELYQRLLEKAAVRERQAQA